MNRDGLQQVRERIKEFYLLDHAKKELASRTDSQRASIRAYYDAAARRLAVARDLRSPDETPAAVTLYRQGGLLLALAYLAANEPQSGLDALTPDAVVRMLDAALDDQDAKNRPELEQIKHALLSSDPLESDRLAVEEAARRAEELEAATRWLESLVDPRSPRELERSRIARWAGTAALAIGSVLLVIMWVTAPPNIAKGKIATGSAAMFETNPSGVVDGSKSGTYGFHSVEEDAAWVSIDLARSYTLTKVMVYGRGDGHTELSVPLAFETSEDGASFQQVTSRGTPFGEADPWSIEPTTPLRARFLRFRKLARGYLVLSEIEAYGKKAR
jgi:hypothetical protein